MFTLSASTVNVPPSRMNTCHITGSIVAARRGMGLSAAHALNVLKPTLTSRCHPVHKSLTAGQMSFPASHRYGEATAKRRHSPGTPLSV